MDTHDSSTRVSWEGESRGGLRDPVSLPSQHNSQPLQSLKWETFYYVATAASQISEWARPAVTFWALLLGFIPPSHEGRETEASLSRQGPLKDCGSWCHYIGQSREGVPRMQAAMFPSCPG